jgi:uncharacterized membrane protein YphA (DoxX/SURF4 family)
MKCLFPLVLRLALGGIFIAAGVTKIWPVKVHASPFSVTVSSCAPDASEFADSILNYRVPPRALTNLVAITMPWIELLAGAMFALGVWKRASALVITGLMVVFLLAISQAVMRGLNINCGCFGTVEGRKVGLIALAEDTAMLAAAVWLTRREKVEEGPPT